VGPKRCSKDGLFNTFPTHGLKRSTGILVAAALNDSPEEKPVHGLLTLSWNRIYPLQKHLLIPIPLCEGAA
jgi:hypothetical protein